MDGQKGMVIIGHQSSKCTFGANNTMQNQCMHLSDLNRSLKKCVAKCSECGRPCEIVPKHLKHVGRVQEAKFPKNKKIIFYLVRDFPTPPLNGFSVKPV